MRCGRARPVDPAAPAVDLGPLSGRGAYAWYDAAHLLVCDARGLWLRSLDGAETALAGPDACFIER